MKIDTVIRLTQDCPLTKTDDVVLALLSIQACVQAKCFIRCPVCLHSAQTRLSWDPLLSINISLRYSFCFIPEQWVLRDIPLPAFLYLKD